MEITYVFPDKTPVVAKYDKDGYFEHVSEILTGKKLMCEHTQFGSGYEIVDAVSKGGFISMPMCEAVYIRIIDFDIYIPKFIFIKP